MTHKERMDEIEKMLTHKVSMKVQGRISSVLEIPDMDVEYLLARVRTLTKALEEIENWDTVLNPSWPITDIARKALEGE